MEDETERTAIDLSEIDEKIRALMQFLSVDDPEEISDEGHNSYKYGREEYLVLTDDEADKAQDESFEEYIDEMIRELPEHLRNYFDREAWKRDASYDGRGHTLSSYDGAEHEEDVDGTWYYIYRTN